MKKWVCCYFLKIYWATNLKEIFYIRYDEYIEEGLKKRDIDLINKGTVVIALLTQ